MSWPTTTLQSIVVPGSSGLKRGPFGGAIKKEIFVAQGYKIYEQQHAISGDFDVGRYFIDEMKFRELKGFSVAPDDLLVSCSGTMGRVAIVPKSAQPGIINQALLRIRPDQEKVLPRFLKRLLETPEMQQKLFGGSSGSAIKNVQPLEEIRAAPIKIPPLPEQRRIAAILDAADSLRAKRRAALAKLDQLAQSIFIEMFGDPIANDRKWPIATVSDFVAGFTSGKNLIASDDEEYISDFRVLKVSAVSALEYRPEESKSLPFDYTPPDSHLVHSGDLLFSRANTAELIGATAMVYETPANHVLPDKIWRFVWHGVPRADPHFVWFLFRQRSFRHEISKRGTGTSGSMKNISQEKVLSIPTALPPLSLQRQFAERAAVTSQLRKVQKKSLADLDMLFASLQHGAFRGDL